MQYNTTQHYNSIQYYTTQHCTDSCTHFDLLDPPPPSSPLLLPDPSPSPSSSLLQRVFPPWDATGGISACTETYRMEGLWIIWEALFLILANLLMRWMLTLHFSVHLTLPSLLPFPLKHTNTHTHIYIHLPMIHILHPLMQSRCCSQIANVSGLSRNSGSNRTAHAKWPPPLLSISLVSRTSEIVDIYMLSVR